MLSSLLWSDYLKTHSQTSVCICCCICEVFMSMSKRVSIFIVSLSVSFPYLNLVTASIFYLSPSNTTLSHLALLFGSVFQSFVFSLCLLFLPSTALIPLNPCHTSFHLSSSTSIFLHFHQLLSSFPPPVSVSLPPLIPPPDALFSCSDGDWSVSHSPLHFLIFDISLFFWSPCPTPLLSPMYTSPFLPLSASSSRGERLLCRVMAPSLPSLIEPEAKYRRAVKTEHL